MDPTPTSGSHSLRHAIARLVAAMMIADRRLSIAEIDEAARLDHIGLGPLSPLVGEELQRATRMPIDVDDACRALAGTGPALLGTVLSVLAGVAASDGTVDDDERRTFAAIARRLGVGTCEIGDFLESEQRPVIEPRDAAPTGTGGGVGGGDRVLALEALGLGATATPAEVDAAYLRLVERYDPAKVAALGAEFVVLVVEKLADLTSLYRVARHASDG